MNKNKSRYELTIVSTDLVFLKALEYMHEIGAIDGSIEIKELKE